MAHTAKDKDKLLLRVRRIRGQVEARSNAPWQESMNAPTCCSWWLPAAVR